MKSGLSLALVLVVLVGLGQGSAHAEQTQNQGSGLRATSARLNFQLAIERMIFLRVGAGGAQSGTASGAGPAASSTLSRVDISLAPVSIPDATSLATNGNSREVAWTGAAPLYSSGNSVTLPVEVRSNAGQIRLTAQTSGPLSNGSQLIPMSRITVSSDSTALPAPLIPDSGIGASVNVSTGGSGTAAAPTLLTYRSASWTFRYTPVANPMAGVYSGRITFTASAP